jgi:hypothetical protein
VISEDFRFEGFDTRDYLNLLSLFRGQDAPSPAAGASFDAAQARGTLVTSRACASGWASHVRWCCTRARSRS